MDIPRNLLADAARGEGTPHLAEGAAVHIGRRLRSLAGEEEGRRIRCQGEGVHRHRPTGRGPGDGLRVSWRVSEC